MEEVEEQGISWGNVAKKAWILLQGTMMTIYLIIGIRAYNKVQNHWSVTKTLFCLQSVVVALLVVLEFTTKAIQGMYLIILGSSYCMFLTKCIVVDSCLTPECRKRRDSMYRSYRIFRAIIHTLSAFLFVSVFWMHGC